MGIQVNRRGMGYGIKVQCDRIGGRKTEVFRGSEFFLIWFGLSRNERVRGY